MQNLSLRHRRAALKAPAAVGIATKEYMILDSHHKPDLRGELAGGKVYVRSDKQYVKLTQRQAKFYLDQGMLAVVPVTDTSKPVKHGSGSDNK